MAWLEDWTNRYQITIDGSKIDGDIVDFPLPIVLSSGTGIVPFDASGIFNELSAVSGTMFTEDFTTMSGWSIVTGSGNVDSGYLYATVEPTDIRSNSTFYFDSNFDLTFRMKWDSGGSWVNYGEINFGYNTSTTNYTLTVEWRNRPDGAYFGFYKRVASTTTTIKALAPAGFGAGYWFNIHVRKNGNDFLCRSWRDGYAEPTAWECIIKNAYDGTEEKSGKIRVYRTYTNFGVDNIVIKNHYPMTLQKMAMTSSDGTTQLPVEIEYWDQYTKVATLWTKVPMLSSGVGTDLYLYYDNTKPNNTTYIGYTGDAVAESVWDSNFKAVYHFNSNAENTSLGFKDSTSTHNHGTSSSMNNTVVGGKIGTAWSFDGSDDIITVSDNSTLDLVNDYTLEAVVYPTTKETVDQIISKTGSDITGYQLRGDTGIYSFMSGVGSTGNYAYNNNTWYYLVGTFSGTALKFYVNGYLYDSDTASTSGTPTNSYPFYIGRRWDSYFFNGNMAEIRVSSTTRGPAWIKASYYGMWNELLTYESQDLPINICSGVVYVDDSLANGITVRLYRRSNGELIDETITSVSGNFTLGSVYLDEHYVVGLYTTSGTNALIYDWIAA